jgi:predicted metalloprotease with PDZ domain
MHYFIYRKNILSQFIQIRLSINCNAGETISLQLPAWRPGRYELANYAQKIKGFRISSEDKAVSFEKITKDLWQFSAGHAGEYLIEYEFHSNQMDAGGSWSDDEQLYLNFINFIFEVIGRQGENITVQLDLPDNFRVATALPSEAGMEIRARNFQHLVDSPLIASPTLRQETYQVGGTSFHLWFQGEVHFEMDELLQGFQDFTVKQIESFGEFPATDYHFLFQLLPYKHYHGVEHQYSTVITIGPAVELKDKKLMDELFGVSSHELYHFWNVCRIRPQELLPYDFSKEAYLKTGVVAEGVTTYMGDIFLLKSGYHTLEEYLKILEKQLDKEFESFGWQNQSIVDSSMDLWLDGYKAGIPDKKVSIYNRGALISLTLDLMLLDMGSSLHEVMLAMWQRFGQTDKGYSMEDYQNIVATKLGDQELAKDFFLKYVSGTEDIRPLLESQLRSVGIDVNTQPRENYFESKLGMVLNEQGVIQRIHPSSPAFEKIMLNDKILEVNGQSYDQKFLTEEATANLKLERYGRQLEVSLPVNETYYYLNYKLQPLEENEKRRKWMT